MIAKILHHSEFLIIGEQYFRRPDVLAMKEKQKL
jgi:hypothetical protein